MSTQKIHQIQVAYSKAEDRLLLRFNTTDGTEFRFWLTRLFVVKFWPGLVNTLETNLQGTPGQNPESRKSVLNFMHQAVVEQANFEERFRTAETPCPLGESPVLVCRAQIQPKGEGLHTLSLFPEKGYGVELGVDQNLLHLLCKLIQNAVSQCDWGIKIQMPGSDREDPFLSGFEHSKDRRLH